MECVIYMGSEDVRRQALNVFRIEMLGAKVIAAQQTWLNSHQAQSFLGCASYLWLMYPQRCRKRGLPRLGDKPVDNPLLGWLRHWTSSFPNHRP